MIGDKECSFIAAPKLNLCFRKTLILCLAASFVNSNLNSDLFGRSQGLLTAALMHLTRSLGQDDTTFDCLARTCGFGAASD